MAVIAIKVAILIQINVGFIYTLAFSDISVNISMINLLNQFT